MDAKPDYLIPLCTIVAVLVLAIDFNLKESLLREARELERIMRDARARDTAQEDHKS